MYSYYIVLLYILYLLYVQYSPGMGNIWYRNNSYFSPFGAFKITIAPLYLYYFWFPSLWDINFFIWIIIYLILTSCFNVFYN